MENDAEHLDNLRKLMQEAHEWLYREEASLKSLSNQSEVRFLANRIQEIKLKISEYEREYNDLESQLLSGVGQTASHSIFRPALPLQKPSEFFGRQADIKNIFNRIKQHGCVSLVGERRIGKSWLLSYLRLTVVNQLGQQFRVINLDLMTPACDTPSGFCETVLQGLKLDTSGYSCDMLGLEQALKMLHKHDRVPILLLDEFDSLSRNPAYQPRFFENLRALANGGLLPMVTVSRHSLVDTIKQLDVGSPFFNLFRECRVKIFTQAEADNFMQQQGKQAAFVSDDVTRLIQIAKSHPLRLQLAGQLWQEELENAQLDNRSPDWSELEIQYNEQCHAYRI